MRILLVDDEPRLRGVLIRVLRDAGYEMVGVNDSLAALNACKSAETPYDLVRTNNRMPHVSGAEIIARLRVDCPGLAIIHLDDGSTDFILPNDVPNLGKPIPHDQLLALVATELRHTGRRAQRHAEA